MKIAAIGDIHYTTDSSGLIATLLGDINKKADILLLAGDLTYSGLAGEMELLLTDLSYIKIPILAVLGNHDYHNDQVEIIVSMMKDQNVIVLDGTSFEINKIGFVGTKGFCGGFGQARIQPFGEPALKTFIKETMDEVSRLERALSEIRAISKHIVALLHYSPILDTLIGEKPELYAFLGSELLCSPLDMYKVDVAFHGHAHHGTGSGQTATNIPVFNVSRFVQSRGGQPPYVIFEVPGP